MGHYFLGIQYALAWLLTFLIYSTIAGAASPADSRRLNGGTRTNQTGNPITPGLLHDIYIVIVTLHF